MPVHRFPVTITDARAGVCTNVWHIRTAPIASDLQANINAAAAAIRAFYASQVTQLPSGTTVKGDFATDVVESTDVPVTFATVTGTSAGNVAPPHLAICISWKTSIRGRRARGRTFLGPLHASVLDTDGTVATAVQNAVRTEANNLVTASMVDNGWAVAIWGQENAMPKADAASRAAAPHVARDIIGATVNDRFAVMRSRRPR